MELSTLDKNPSSFTPPDGFSALNIAATRPETVISRPDQYVGVTTYEGQTGNKFVNNAKPDFVWIK